MVSIHCLGIDILTGLGHRKAFSVDFLKVKIPVLRNNISVSIELQTYGCPDDLRRLCFVPAGPRPVDKAVRSRACKLFQITISSPSKLCSQEFSQRCASA